MFGAKTPRSYTCARCLEIVKKQRRAFQSTRPEIPPATDVPTNTATIREPLPRKSSPKGQALISNRSLIQVSGVDAAKFLQGLTTNNIRHSTTPFTLNTAFLNAQGRIDWDAILYGQVDSEKQEQIWMIEVDAGLRDGLYKHLMKHKLRSKVRLSKRDDLSVWASWNSELSPQKHDSDRLTDPRQPGYMQRWLQSKESSDNNETSPADLLQYTLNRFIHGIPEGPQEMIPGHALVQESNLDYLNGVDFKKGCYVGQELTIRTQHTGVVRKRILPVQLYRRGEKGKSDEKGTDSASSSRRPTRLHYDPDALDEQTLSALATTLSTSPIDILKSSPSARRSIGKLLANVGNIGLALCRLETMTHLHVSAEGGTYTEEDEFVLKIGGEGDKGVDEASGSRALGGIGIKAFVPGWMRERVEGEWERKRMKLERERERELD